MARREFWRAVVVIFTNCAKTDIEIGQFFINTDLEDGEKVPYLLSLVEPTKVCLVSLDNGNRWNDVVAVQNPINLSAEEVEEIFDSPTYTTWTLVFRNDLLKEEMPNEQRR